MSDSNEPPRFPRPSRPASVPWESLAEHRIRVAQAEGQFDDLPGFGQPIPGLEGEYDENWWIKGKLKREGLSMLPPGLQVRLDVERELARIWALCDEGDVRQAVTGLNELIRRAHYASSVGFASTTQPLGEQEVVEEWRRRRRSHSK